jgi:hypothetical protein
MKRIFTVSAICIFLLAGQVFAHVEMLNVHVLSFKINDQRDRCILKFSAITTDDGYRINLPPQKRLFEVHLIPSKDASLEEIKSGISILEKRISNGSDISIGRMSGRGWSPVPGKKGIFQSGGIKVHRPEGTLSDDDAVIYFTAAEQGAAANP